MNMMVKQRATQLAVVMPAMLWLAACAPAPSEALPAASAASPPPSPVAKADSTSMQPSERPAAASTSASIGGEIRDGNRAPPALRVCATPVTGGPATCVDTQAGAGEYRVEVAPGRYTLLGWAQSGELALIAHATQIRCIKAPCPPDELIEVTVAAGEQRDGVDLNGGYIQVPDGWPQRPE